MLRRGLFRVVACTQAHRTCATTVKSAVGAKAWLSATTSGRNDDPTPAKTKLTFSSSVYGKDPASAAEPTSAEVAAAARLKQDAEVGTAGMEAGVAPIHDNRNMFDSTLSQQADDGKASDAIKRDVATDTPDATRVAFGATAYGKDPQAAAALSDQETAGVEALRMRAQGGGAAAGCTAAPVHDTRSMFDSDLTQGAGSTRASDAIKRDVAADTPDATRVAFRASAYGKDAQSAAALSEQEAAEVEALRMTAEGGGAAAGAAAAPVHDSRSMFDSDLTQGAGSTRASDAIKRDVAADTPDATRVAFGATAYGKDSQAAAALSEQEAAEVEALRVRAQSGGAPASTTAAPVHDSRSMFDSDLTQGAGSTQGSDSIKRDVAADTPDATRVAFRESAYGKDAQSAAAFSEQEAAEVEALRMKAEGGGAAAGAAAPVHDSRSMFDSDLTQGAGNTQGSDSIKRQVATDTPEATRLVFGGSDYGKDQRSLARSEEKQAEIDALAARVGAGTTSAAAAPIHHDRSMFDSDLAEGAGSARESKAIKRDVETATPALTRLSFFGSTYGDDDPGENKAEHAQELAEKQKKGAKLARVGRGAPRSKLHDTKRAMADDEYSPAGSE